jgi:hypothetical protein
MRTAVRSSGDDEMRLGTEPRTETISPGRILEWTFMA